MRCISVLIGHLVISKTRKFVVKSVAIFQNILVFPVSKICSESSYSGWRSWSNFFFNPSKCQSPGGKCGRCVRLTTLSPPCAVIMKSGNLNFLEPSGPLHACNGTDLPFFTSIQESLDSSPSHISNSKFILRVQINVWYYTQILPKKRVTIWHKY